MGYTLKAIISRAEVFNHLKADLADSKIVLLTQSISMLPITEKFFDQTQKRNSPEGADPFRGFEYLSSALVNLAVELSVRGPVAYIEAEFFGGVGEQAAIVWQNRNVMLSQIKSSDAINRTLKLLGVERSVARDEFDSIGLGRHRHTEDWVMDADV